MGAFMDACSYQVKARVLTEMPWLCNAVFDELPSCISCRREGAAWVHLLCGAVCSVGSIGKGSGSVAIS